MAVERTRRRALLLVVLQLFLLFIGVCCVGGQPQHGLAEEGKPQQPQLPQLPDVPFGEGQDGEKHHEDRQMRAAVPEASPSPPAPSGTPTPTEADVSGLIKEAQEEIHRETTVLATVSEEIERLQSLWRLMALGDLKSNLQSRKVWQKEIEEIKQELSSLLHNLNETEKDLVIAHEEIHAREEGEALVEKIKDGSVGINYETGELEEGQPSGNTTTAVSIPASLPSVVTEEITKLQQEADPAILHLDVDMLKDVVTLSITTAVGGFLASTLYLPATSGYMIGGMIVGPSGLKLIDNVVQVQTLAAFGSIFLLFCHGMMYSSQYHGRQGSLPEAFSAGVFILGGIFLLVAFLCTIMAGFEVHQAILVASAVSLSSTTTATHTLQQSKIRETTFGKTLVELMALQDLLMAPLLSFPTVVNELLFEYGMLYMFPTLLCYCVAIIGAALFARNVIPKIVNLRYRSENMVSPDLFILGIVSYCLGMSLLTEKMGLSHEAGAVLAGLVLTDAPNVSKAVAAIEPMTSLFGGLYLGSLGMILSPMFLLKHWGHIFMAVVAVIVIKMVVVAIGLQALGFSRKASFLGGLSLAHISEISLFLMAHAHEYHLISRHLYLMVVATTVMLLVLTPLSIHAFIGIDRSEYKTKANDSALSKVFNSFLYPSSSHHHHHHDSGSFSKSKFGQVV